MAKAPIKVLLSAHRGRLVIAFGVTCLNAVGFYLVLSYMPTYVMTELGFSETNAFITSVFSLLSYVGIVFLMGALSDRFGRKKLLITASILFALLTVPLFMVLGYSGFIGIVLVQIALGAMLAMNDGTLPCFLSELFPTKVRYRRLRSVFQFGERTVRRHRAIRGDLADPFLRQQACAGLVPGRALPRWH